MWTPTHVQVTVVRASNLLYKGKNGMNDAFVTIALGKERYQTSVKEKSTNPVQWNEECELSIPKQGNSAEIVLTALNRNFIGDDFLGVVRIPLSDFDVSATHTTFIKKYQIQNKPGKDNSKKRGELEVKTGFIVKQGVNVGSLSDLSKKEGHRSSFGQFVGGSLLSLGKEKKGLKKLAKAVGNKVSTLPGRGKKKVKEDGFGAIPEQYISSSKQNRLEADPGVISDDEDDFRFDELSHKSSHSSLSVSHGALSTPKDGSLENLGGGEFLRKTFATPPPKKPSRTQPQHPSRSEDFKTVNNEVSPIDDWESKLFGRQQHGGVPLSSSPVLELHKTPLPPLSVMPEYEKRPEPTITKPDQSIQQPKSEAVISNKNVEAVKEPIPKPRQVQDILKMESKFRSTSCEDLSKVEKIKPKETFRSSTKEAFVSLFSSPKIKGSDEKLNQNQKGTPIGITNPIRLKESQVDTRLPRETIRKFEGKSRDDLIETITSLQTTVDKQKQKINDMENYLETLLVRVMENKPMLLQSPYVNVNGHHYKSTKWGF